MTNAAQHEMGRVARNLVALMAACTVGALVAWVAIYGHSPLMTPTVMITISLSVLVVVTGMASVLVGLIYAVLWAYGLAYTRFDLGRLTIAGARLGRAYVPSGRTVALYLVIGLALFTAGAFLNDLVVSQ